MKAKHVFLLIAGLISASNLCFGQQQKLFDRFAGQDGVSSVHISKAMFDMLPSLGDAGGVKLSRLKKIDGIHLLSTKKDGVREEMRATFKKLITEKHEELMRIRDEGGDDVTFHVRKNGTDIEELVMLVDGVEEFTVILILGHFTLEDIRDVASKASKHIK
ncbi:MAG: DUF4252 domain-containing protein [Tannerella sp.]|jgi:hypothetical protein|nr:DUF4252 domain-containing protein [Tannerella sp.]